MSEGSGEAEGATTTNSRQHKMTTTQVKGASSLSVDDIEALLDRRGEATEDADAEDLRLLALEIIMYDPDLAKQLMKAGVKRVMRDSPTAAG